MTNEPCYTQIEALFQNLVAIIIENRCWVSVVGVEACSGLYGPEFESRQGAKYFYFPRPTRSALGSIILLCYGYRGSFPEIKGAGT